ncbi:hypothetical protein [Halomicrococcus gelatinilyticus]|uniref:hypothetical protein n=1 Tax=Halomicrococcus gelatinilyticus TaxID=1702103 RepID=UPI002E164B4F
MPSIPPQLRAFVRPAATFGDWTPSLGVALLLVMLAGAANAYGVAQTAGVVGESVSGTATVDNPARPPDAICEGYFGDDDPPADCDRPGTIEKRLDRVARNAVNAGVPQALLTPFAVWVLLAALFALVTGEAGRPDGETVEQFGELLVVTAWGVSPASLRYLARPLAVSGVVEGWSHPTTVDALRTAARDAATVTDSTAFLALFAATLAWQAFVLAGALRGVRDVSRGSAAVIAGVPTLAAFGSAVVVGPFAYPTAMPNVLLGLLVVGVGTVGFLVARTFIAVETFFDLVGMRQSSAEPHDWYVWLHRAGGVGVMVLGFALFDGLRYL